MAPLSKLTLTSYRRTQPNRDPVEERRSKTLAALEQKLLENTPKAITVFNTVILLKHTQKTVYRLCMRKL